MNECKNDNCHNPITGLRKLYCSSWCRANQNRRNYKQRNIEQWRLYQRTAKGLKKLRHHIEGDPCLLCGSVANLQVHHIIKTREGGNNAFSNLVVLCSSCHADWHRLIDPVVDQIRTGQTLDVPIPRML